MNALLLKNSFFSVYSLIFLLLKKKEKDAHVL